MLSMKENLVGHGISIGHQFWTNFTQSIFDTTFLKKLSDAQRFEKRWDNFLQNKVSIQELADFEILRPYLEFDNINKMIIFDFRNNLHEEKSLLNIYNFVQNKENQIKKWGIVLPSTKKLHSYIRVDGKNIPQWKFILIFIEYIQEKFNCSFPIIVDEKSIISSSLELNKEECIKTSLLDIIHTLDESLGEVVSDSIQQDLKSNFFSLTEDKNAIELMKDFIQQMDKMLEAQEFLHCKVFLQKNKELILDMAMEKYLVKVLRVDSNQKN